MKTICFNIHGFIRPTNVHDNEEISPPRTIEAAAESCPAEMPRGFFSAIRAAAAATTAHVPFIDTVTWQRWRNSDARGRHDVRLRLATGCGRPRHDTRQTRSHCRIIAGPASQTLALRWYDIGPITRVCWTARSSGFVCKHWPRTGTRPSVLRGTRSMPCSAFLPYSARCWCIIMVRHPGGGGGGNFISTIDGWVVLPYFANIYEFSPTQFIFSI